jgi:type IV secretion system protein VirD4
VTAQGRAWGGDGRDRRGPAGTSARHEGGRPGTALLVAGLAVAAWVWLTGELAGWLWRGRWPRTPPLDALVVAVRLPEHLAHPTRAWPIGARPALPGSAALAVTGAVLAGLAVVLAAAVQHWRPDRPARPPARILRAPPRVGGRRRRAGGARWARSADLQALAVGGARPGRLVLGRAGRRLVATESRHSVLVVGPTQSGKTAGLAIPAVLEWEGPVVATSVKGDLAAHTLGWRRRLGECWVFDPTATSGVDGRAGWSPLAEASDWSGAQRVASWMVEATPARGGLSDGAFWFAAAAKLLAPLLLAARAGDGSMADVVRWTNTGQFDEPTALLELCGAVEAATALEACAGRDERLRSSVGTTLETVLAPFEDPVVAAATRRCDIDPERLLGGSHTLYLCGPAHEQARVQGLFASLVSSVVAAAVARAGPGGRPLDPPLLLVLDEAANIAPVRDLDGLASTGAGLGIQLVTVCQDLAQLSARYGAERSRTIANNHRAKLALSGVSDLSTLDLVSGLAGEAAVREESFTADLRDGRRTRSTSVAFRRLAPADQIRRIRPGEGILIYGHLPAAHLRLRPWYEDRTLTRRAATGSESPRRGRAVGCG